VSIGEGKYFILSRPWSTEDGVTVPAGTSILVTPDKERELRDAGFIGEPAGQPGDVPPPPYPGPPPDPGPPPYPGPPVTFSPPEDDPEFLDVHETGPTYPMPT
jgi:hypothetical protein